MKLFVFLFLGAIVVPTMGQENYPQTQTGLEYPSSQTQMERPEATPGSHLGNAEIRRKSVYNVPPPQIFGVSQDGLPFLHARALGGPRRIGFQENLRASGPEFRSLVSPNEYHPEHRFHPNFFPQILPPFLYRWLCSMRKPGATASTLATTTTSPSTVSSTETTTAPSTTISTRPTTSAGVTPR